MSVTIEINRCTDEEGQRISEIVAEAFQSMETGAEKAKEIKTKLDKEFDGSWQCIVGKNFATYVSHEEHKFCHLKVGNQTGVQVFKAGC